MIIQKGVNVDGMQLAYDREQCMVLVINEPSSSTKRLEILSIAEAHYLLKKALLHGLTHCVCDLTRTI